MRWTVCGFVCAGLVVTVLLLGHVRAATGRQSAADGAIIQVWKSRHELQLEQPGEPPRSFRVALGLNPEGDKLERGDNRTPNGQYYICEKRPSSRFRRFLGISYPNIEDADKAFERKLITAEEWVDIFAANVRLSVPPFRTALGGRVGIHGYGGRKALPVDWTEGCLAVSDQAIDFLYDRVSIGTPVIINE
jgi:murein L,D-transpeptidase YafK